MNKVWAEVIVSDCLYKSLQKENKLFDYEDYTLKSLIRVIGNKLAENGITLTDEIKSKITFEKKPQENRDVIYYAFVYIPENSGMQWVK